MPSLRPRLLLKVRAENRILVHHLLEPGRIGETDRFRPLARAIIHNIVGSLSFQAQGDKIEVRGPVDFRANLLPTLGDRQPAQVEGDVPALRPALAAWQHGPGWLGEPAQRKSAGQNEDREPHPVAVRTDAAPCILGQGLYGQIKPASC